MCGRLTEDGCDPRARFDRIVEDSDDLPTPAAVERLGALGSVLPAMTESPVAKPRPIDEVLAALGNRQVLVYYIAEDRPWLVSVSRGKTRILELDPSAKEMQRLARQFRADPDSASVAVYYRDYWFWISDRDLASKRTFAFLMILFNLTQTGNTSAVPLLTVPAG